MKSIRIIICDDHPLIKEGLQSFFEGLKEYRIVATAATAAEVRAKVSDTEADVLLMDVNLPDGNGIDLCTEIKRKFPGLKIIGLSNFNERSVILRMFNSGASGYLVKSSPMEEIGKAIREVHSGNIYFGKDAQQILASLAEAETLVPPITKREKEVLVYLSEGLTSPEIADKMFISSQTVDSHRKNLMQKLKVNKSITLIQVAKELGLI